MNEQREQTDSPPAGISGTFSLGGELAVRRLGFKAMRITGEGIWDHLKTRFGLARPSPTRRVKR
jgi:hypothetical protein